MIAWLFFLSQSFWHELVYSMQFETHVVFYASPFHHVVSKRKWETHFKPNINSLERYIRKIGKIFRSSLPLSLKKSIVFSMASSRGIPCQLYFLAQNTRCQIKIIFWFKSVLFTGKLKGKIHFLLNNLKMCLHGFFNQEILIVSIWNWAKKRSGFLFVFTFYG